MHHPPALLNLDQEEQLKALLKPKVAHNQELENNHQHYNHEQQNGSASRKGKEKEELVEVELDGLASPVKDDPKSPLIDSK